MKYEKWLPAQMCAFKCVSLTINCELTWPRHNILCTTSGIVHICCHSFINKHLRHCIRTHTLRWLSFSNVISLCLLCFWAKLQNFPYFAQSYVQLSSTMPQLCSKNLHTVFSTLKLFILITLYTCSITCPTTLNTLIHLEVISGLLKIF